MTCAKLLAVACAAWTTQALVLGVRQGLADSPLGAAFPTPLNPPRIGPLPSVSVVFTTPTPTATPTGTRSAPSSSVTSDPFPNDSPGTGTGTSTDMPTIPGGSTAPTSLIVLETDPPIHDNDPLSGSNTSNRTLVITLSSVLSSVGLLLLLGALFLFYRIKTRGGRKPLFARGISPIDDDEIATWKVPHSNNEKAPEPDSPPTTATATDPEPTTPSRTHHAHTKSQPSTSSLLPLKKPPSVIVYSNPHGTTHRRCSSDDSYSYTYSPPGSGSTARKMSFDKILPQTPIQARAPNAIPGLTDESVPGAMPFLPPVDPVPHQQRRLSKVRSSHHVRARSSRSGSFGWGDYGGGLEGRHSHDYMPRGYHPAGHWRMGSDLAVGSPPMGRRGGSFEGEIGRAIG